MIRYVTGDATAPQGEGSKVVVHVCNDLGAWGAGFVVAVSRRWPEPERAYRRATPELGAVQFVEVDTRLFVANMVAQHGFPSPLRRCALDYEALSMCLRKVANFCTGTGSSVHMPRIGCGIAGGTWEEVEERVAFAFAGLEVSVYDLP